LALTWQPPNILTLAPRGFPPASYIIYTHHTDWHVLHTHYILHTYTYTYTYMHINSHINTYIYLRCRHAYFKDACYIFYLFHVLYLVFLLGPLLRYCRKWRIGWCCRKTRRRLLFCSWTLLNYFDWSQSRRVRGY
jgi:hypothetical protein